MDTENKSTTKQAIMRMFLKISTWVAIPVISAFYIGKYIDTRLDTAPWAFLLCTGLAFCISMADIWIILSKYIKDIEQEELNKKNLKNGKSS